MRVLITMGFIALILITGLPVAWGETDADLKTEIQQKLLTLSQQIDELTKNIGEIRTKEKTLTREIAAVTKSIEKIQFEIDLTALHIAETEQQIAEIEARIADLKKREDHKRQVLAELIRGVDREDDATLVDILLNTDQLSSLWERLQALDTVQEKIQNEILAIRELKAEQDRELAKLAVTREEQLALKQLQEYQKAELDQERIAKESLRGNIRYQTTFLKASLLSNQTVAERLQRQLFLLEGIGVALPLQDAVAKATVLAEKTGVRPAFLLAVLQKESQWGARVGTGTWRQDMHPRDQAAFLQITKELGLDPDLTLVSRKPEYGWGGAMGPAQFLPNTWLAWKDRIASITGHNPPSPWNIDDAFAAASLKLMGAGADQKTPGVERRAAMIYFAGGNWENPAFQFYGDAVLELTELLEEEIRRLAKQ